MNLDFSIPLPIVVLLIIAFLLWIYGLIETNVQKNDSNFAGYAAILQIWSILSYFVFVIFMVLYSFGYHFVSPSFINYGVIVLSGVITISSTINATLRFRDGKLYGALLYLTNTAAYAASFIFYLLYLLPVT